MTLRKAAFIIRGMNDWVRVVAAVVARRGELGWTQERLARVADVSARTIQSLEAGSRPHPPTRHKIEMALGWESGEMLRIERETSYEAPVLRPDLYKELVGEVGEKEAAAVAEFLERRRRESRKSLTWRRRSTASDSACISSDRSAASFLRAVRDANVTVPVTAAPVATTTADTDTPTRAQMMAVTHAPGVPIVIAKRMTLPMLRVPLRPRVYCYSRSQIRPGVQICLTQLSGIDGKPGHYAPDGIARKITAEIITTTCRPW